MPISVVINTYNASRLLASVLETVSDFDEVIICDMESTDNTVEIAKKYGAKVISFPKGNYDYCEPARNFAISHASNDWVLVVDSDELVPTDLREFLYRFLAKAEKDPSLKGLYIPRCNYVIDRVNKAKYPDYKLRFFARDSANWPPELHSQPEIKGNVSKIPGSKKNLALIHLPRTIKEMMSRVDRYSSVRMERELHRKVNFMSMFMLPAFKFMNSFFVKGECRNGMAGLIVSANRSVEYFYRLAKIYENHERHKIAKGIYPKLPEVIVKEKLRLLNEADAKLNHKE